MNEYDRFWLFVFIGYLCLAIINLLISLKTRKRLNLSSKTSLLNIYTLAWLIEFTIWMFFYFIFRNSINPFINMIPVISTWFWFFVFPCIILVLVYNIIRFLYLYFKK